MREADVAHLNDIDLIEIAQEIVQMIMMSDVIVRLVQPTDKAIELRSPHLRLLLSYPTQTYRKHT